MKQDNWFCAIRWKFVSSDTTDTTFTFCLHTSTLFASCFGQKKKPIKWINVIISNISYWKTENPFFTGGL